VETGYWFKPLKMECPFVEIACFTCHSHVTTTDFLPQFQHQERDLIEQIDLADWPLLFEAPVTLTAPTTTVGVGCSSG
jgi:hypothetical protein